MTRFRKRLLLPLSTLVILFLLAYGTYLLMNARTFQAFGRLVSRVNTNQEIVALTFDDAPTSQVGPVLDLLTARQVPTTIFVIGKQMEEYPAETARMVRAGMELGNHSYSHERMVFQPMSFYAQEIERTNDLLRANGYAGPIFFRPPNSKKLFGLPLYLAQHDITTITMDVEPDTYRPAGLSVSDATKFLVDYALSHTRPGSIIVLHPFCDQACESDRQAIAPIIDGLRTEGYTFVTVDQLLASARPLR